MKYRKRQIGFKWVTGISVDYKKRTHNFFISFPYQKENKKWIITTRKIRPKWKCTTEHSLNPFPHWKRRITWKLTHWYLKLSKQLYKQCEGCGEGISMFRIRNPNHGEGNKYYNCCENCVNFYDWRWSAKDIVGWNPDNTPICKKGNRCIEVSGGKRKRDQLIKRLNKKKNGNNLIEEHPKERSKRPKRKFTQEEMNQLYNGGKGVKYPFNYQTKVKKK